MVALRMVLCCFGARLCCVCSVAQRGSVLLPTLTIFKVRANFKMTMPQMVVISKPICSAAFILLLVLLNSADAIDIGTKALDVNHYLDGKWVLRPVHGAAVSPVAVYTHELTLTASRTLDGDVTGRITPYTPPDAFTSSMVNAFETAGRVVAPWFQYMWQCLWEVVGWVAYHPSVGSVRKEAADAMMAHAADVHTKTLACFQLQSNGDSTADLSDDAIESIIFERLRRSSFAVSLTTVPSTAGTLILTPAPTVETGSIPDSLTSTSTSLSFSPVTHASTPVSEYYRYRAIAFSSRTEEKSISWIIPAVDDEKEAPSAAVDVVVRISGWTLHCIDDVNAVLTILLLKSKNNDGDDGAGATTHPVQFVLRRTSETAESRNLMSTLGTLGLLLVVALVKFGPRYYMKWKGISPNDFLAGRRGAKNRASLDAIKRSYATQKRFEASKLNE